MAHVDDDPAIALSVRGHMLRKAQIFMIEILMNTLYGVKCCCFFYIDHEKMYMLQELFLMRSETKYYEKVSAKDV
jgi:hypothetical protein